MLDTTRKYVIPTVAILLIALLILPVNPAFVESDSMSPEIESGDMFLLYESNTYQVGDIVLFESSNGEDIITHRIVNRTSEGFITQGDNNQIPDQELNEEPVQKEQIVGEVAEFRGSALTVSDAGKIARFVNTYQIQILAVVFVFLFIDVLGLYSISPDNRRDRTKTNQHQVSYPSPLKITLVLSIALIAVWSGVIYASSETVVSEDIDVGEGENDDISIGETRTSTVNVSVQSALPLQSRAYFIGQGQVEDITELPSSKEGDINIRYTVGPYAESTSDSYRVAVYSYPFTLPSDVVTSLHFIHPLLACIGTSSVIAIPAVTIVYLFFDTAPLKLKSNRGFF